MTKKDLLRQYVDTGLKLPQYQVELLTPNLLKTYLRKRSIAVEQIVWATLEEYEFNLMPQDIKNIYIERRINQSYQGFLNRIKKWEYDDIPEEKKITYLKNILKLVITGKYNELLMLMMGGTNTGRLEQWEYEDVGRYLGEEYQKKYLSYRVKNNANLEMWEFDELDYKGKIVYINRMERINNPFIDFFNRLGEDRYFELTGRKLTEKPNKSNGDWDIPKPPQGVNQVYESLKRHKQIISYGN